MDSTWMSMRRRIPPGQFDAAVSWGEVMGRALLGPLLAMPKPLFVRDSAAVANELSSESNELKDMRLSPAVAVWPCVFSSYMYMLLSRSRQMHNSRHEMEGGQALVLPVNETQGAKGGTQV